MFSVELCAGAGGQALGLEQAGFKHQALIEIDEYCCNTLLLNRPSWNVIQEDLRKFDASNYKGADLLAGGLPCPPFSVAGKQLGKADERNLFPDAIRIADEIRPRAILIENVRGFLDAAFEDYRLHLKSDLEKLGYKADWRLINASDFGVPQLRPRVVIVALKEQYTQYFKWPEPNSHTPITVGEALYDLMNAKGWKGAKKWRNKADSIAPTLVGGSKKHGGPDLGPTRSKKAWQTLGTDGSGVWDEAPDKDYIGLPRLTVRMCARLQGFPDEWLFAGKKTASYRQVGNAFPPPVAKAVAEQLALAIQAQTKFYRIAG